MLCDLKIFENNKMKYSLHFAAVSLPASMVIAKFRAIHGGNTRRLMCSEFNIMVFISHNILLTNWHD